MPELGHAKLGTFCILVMEFIRKGTWRYVFLECITCSEKKEVRIDVFNRLRKSGELYECRSCGAKARLYKHGLSINKKQKISEENWLYRRWQAMKKRCSIYDSYKSRGIVVCLEWKDNFMAFKEWAESNGADPTLELDRIDNNLSYSPNNCRWVTHKENCRPGGRSGKFEK